MLAAVKTLFRKKADTWLFQKREHEPGEVELNQRRVFIVPARAGASFAALLLLLFTGSINYNLGLGFVLTFFTGACAIVDMFLTAKNLAMLRLAPGRAPPVFAGEEALFELQLINRTRRDRYAVWLDFISAGEPRHVADVAAGASTSVRIAAPTAARGWMAAPRVRLVTRFPLGLFRAWSYWQPDARVLVYPFPETEAPPLPLTGIDEGRGSGHAGNDDFAGVRNYQAGDPMRRLAWRQIARFDPSLGGPLVTKHFEGGAAAELCLDFALLPAQLDVEARLSRLTRWVLDAEQRALPYAFRLGPLRLAAALGEAHRAACLQALALYGQAGAAP
ncbi:MAG TPA: DUF58 domain-containing protein [Janthinobacterium sp.]|jgi:uncharacterized protein (DUF58 family)|nr:DUF58 domain-containing protein [Janthinobacterium sp.]